MTHSDGLLPTYLLAGQLPTTVALATYEAGTGRPVHLPIVANTVHNMAASAQAHGLLTLKLQVHDVPGKVRKLVPRALALPNVALLVLCDTPDTAERFIHWARHECGLHPSSPERSPDR